MGPKLNLALRVLCWSLVIAIWLELFLKVFGMLVFFLTPAAPYR